MKIKKLLCLLTATVIAISAFAGNAFAYFDGTTDYSNAPRTKIGSFTYILKQNVQYGSIKFPYSATVVDISNIQKVEIPEKVTVNGIEYTVTDLDLCGDYSAIVNGKTTTENKYTQVEEIILPETIYNITGLLYFPNLTKLNIPKNTLIARGKNNFVSTCTVYFDENFHTYYEYSTGYPKLTYLAEPLTGCPKLTLLVDPKNSHYSYKNDMLLSKDGKILYMSFNHSTDIIIPDGVEDILNHGGIGFYHVKNVKLPDTLKRVRHFDGSKITEINLPEGLEKIGWEAFYESKLTKIIIPDSVKKIDGYAFTGTNLKTVKFGKNLKAIGSRAFKKCKKLKSVTITKNVRFIELAAFKNCKKLKSVKILSDNIVIENQVFKDCTNLKNVTINGAAKIDVGAFCNCKNLSKITINNKDDAPEISNPGGLRNIKKGLKFVVKNKNVAKSLKKQLKGSKVKNAKILVGKKVVYTNING